MGKWLLNTRLLSGFAQHVHGLLPGVLLISALSSSAAPSVPASQATAAAVAPAATVSQCPQPLRVGVSMLGLNYFLQGSTAVGTDLELIKGMSERLGLSYQIVEMSRARLFVSMERGDYIDVAASVVPQSTSENLFVPTAITRQYFVVSSRVDRPELDLDRFVHATDLHLGVVADARYDSFISGQLSVLREAGRLETTRKSELLLPGLLAGRYDAVIVTSATYANTQQFRPGDFRVVPIPQEPRFLVGLALSPTLLPPTCRAAIARTVSDMHRDGSLLRLTEQYYGAELARDRTDFDEAMHTKPEPRLGQNDRRP